VNATDIAATVSFVKTADGWGRKPDATTVASRAPTVVNVDAQLLVKSNFAPLIAMSS
jgi:hypothetical protein